MTAAPPWIAVFTDLDDTLFQTLRKMTGGVEAARCAAVAANGRDSYMTPAQEALFGWMRLAADLVVPVTARGSEAFSRVLLPFDGPAIVANGAVILDAERRPDPVWEARVAAALEAARPVLETLPDRARAAAAATGFAIRTWLVEEPGLGGVYAVVKAEPGEDEARLADLAPALEEVAGPAWRTHRNANNLALIPPGVSKASAVAHVLERLRRDGLCLALGCGDSATDLDFMRLCDTWLTPAGSQVDRLLGDPDDGAGRTPR
jgi:hydroxymethylpyrimidine pyrophosphatase-like HAD family hydrolase